MITLPGLSEAPGVRHGFFTRRGGVSAGIYAALNCGLGSRDDPEAVAENRARAADRLGVEPHRLVTLHQVHSPDVVIVQQPWAPGNAPRADAMVTAVPGIMLGSLGADCAAVLFADPDAGVIGAAHAGWKGAKGGVLEATVGKMEALGARRERITAGIGPRIGRASYEVGAEFRAAFVAECDANVPFFAPGVSAGKFLFDLGGYIAARLRRLSLAGVEACDNDTLAEAESFFSYRRSVLKGEPDYGRNLSAIVLSP